MIADLCVLPIPPPAQRPPFVKHTCSLIHNRANTGTLSHPHMHVYKKQNKKPTQTSHIDRERNIDTVSVCEMLLQMDTHTQNGHVQAYTSVLMCSKKECIKYKFSCVSQSFNEQQSKTDLNLRSHCLVAKLYFLKVWFGNNWNILAGSDERKSKENATLMLITESRLSVF